MALVHDTFDPSGMGMFSKVGRGTTEKFYILRRRDEILADKKKQVKVPLYHASNRIVSETG